MKGKKRGAGDIGCGLSCRDEWGSAGIMDGP
jgi:hypothetical protein